MTRPNIPWVPFGVSLHWRIDEIAYVFTENKKRNHCVQLLQLVSVFGETLNEPTVSGRLVIRKQIIQFAMDNERHK